MLILLVVLAFPTLLHGTLLNGEDFESSKSDFLDAVDEIISNGFRANPDAVTINFVVSLSDETKRERSELINNLLARCDVVYLEDAELITHHHRLFNVIFIEDFKSFLRLSRRAFSDNFVIDGAFLFVLVNGTFDELPEVIRVLWKSFIRKVNFVVEIGNETNLITFNPFSNDNGTIKCDDSTPVSVKTFNRSVKSKTNTFPGRISNLFQCPLKVVSFNAPPMMMIEYDSENNYNLKGIDGEMLKLLARIFNFKIDLLHFSDLIR